MDSPHTPARHYSALVPVSAGIGARRDVSAGGPISLSVAEIDSIVQKCDKGDSPALMGLPLRVGGGRGTSPDGRGEDSGDRVTAAAGLADCALRLTGGSDGRDAAGGGVVGRGIETGLPAGAHISTKASRRFSNHSTTHSRRSSMIQHHTRQAALLSFGLSRPHPVVSAIHARHLHSPSHSRNNPAHIIAALYAGLIEQEAPNPTEEPCLTWRTD